MAPVMYLFFAEAKINGLTVTVNNTHNYTTEINRKQVRS